MFMTKHWVGAGGIVFPFLKRGNEWGVVLFNEPLHHWNDL